MEQIDWRPTQEQIDRFDKRNREKFISEICGVLSRYSRYDQKSLEDTYETVQSIDKLLIAMNLASYLHTSLNAIAEEITDPLI